MWTPLSKVDNNKAIYFVTIRIVVIKIYRLKRKINKREINNNNNKTAKVVDYIPS